MDYAIITHVVIQLKGQKGEGGRGVRSVACGDEERRGGGDKCLGGAETWLFYPLLITENDSLEKSVGVYIQARGGVHEFGGLQGCH